MSNYIWILVPDSIIQILWIIFLGLGIPLQIIGYRTERRKMIEVERLKNINDDLSTVFGMPWKEGRELIKSKLEKKKENSV